MSDGIQVFDGSGEEAKHIATYHINDLDEARKIISVLASQIAMLGLSKKKHHATFISAIVDGLFDDRPELRAQIFANTKRIMLANPTMKQCLK